MVNVKAGNGTGYNREHSYRQLCIWRLIIVLVNTCIYNGQTSVSVNKSMWFMQRANDSFVSEKLHK